MSIRSSLLASGILAFTPTGYLLAQDAHVHGIAAINLVLENTELQIEFESPAANIVGFEHKAESEADKLAIEQALETLRNAKAVFGLPASADCRVQAVEAELHGYDEHGEHGGDHRETHGHDEHAGHGEHKEAHSEFHAHYHFECGNSSEIAAIALRLFASFPGIREIQLQAITPWGQFGGDIEARDAQIKLR